MLPPPPRSTPTDTLFPSTTLFRSENIHLGNFDAEGFESALDMVVAGQFAMYIDEDQEEGGLVFQHWSLAEVSVGSTRADGRIDIVHREYKLTAEAAAREFGEDKLPDGIRRKLRDKPDEELDRKSTRLNSSH